ncbi:MAG: Ig-like domain-containing protein [Deltaproteobacteria bacterium]|nr:Ig-like domain-containing protein [Deltaproteobacteria bacterium]
MTNYGFEKTSANHWIGTLAVAALLLVASGGKAHARSSYLSTFNTTYGTSGTALNSCSLCHPGGNTGQFNPFADAFRNNGHSFPAIESLDSDGDGFINSAEITARTFPGDPASKPGPSDTTPPTVRSTNPAVNQTGVAVNTAVTAAFSEAVKSVGAGTFTLRAGSTPVAGTVALSGTTATFTPAAPLPYSTVFTATITTGVLDLANNALAANYAWTFTTGAAPDLAPPTVASTNPVTGATAVPVSGNVAATFSEAVKSVNATTFTLRAGSTPVSGTVALSGTTATFTPSAPLSYSTTYTATVTTGVLDLANNALASNHVWTFTTGAAADTTPPTVGSTSPSNNQTGVAANTAVTANFSEAVKSVNATTFTLRRGTASVTGTVALSGATATFTPSAPLAYNTVYTATVTTGVLDLANNALAADYAWTFTTGAAPDTTPPFVTATNPPNSQADVALNTTISATFSEAMDAASLTTATFTVADRAGNPVAGAVTVTGATATFAPSAMLANGTTYTATVTTGSRDLAGNGLGMSQAWSFTTVPGTVDSDGDGIPDNQDAYPMDNRKTTVPNPMGGQAVTIDSSLTGGTRLTGAGGMADTDPMLNQAGKPAGFGFPNGVVAFNVAGLAPGGTARVAITFPSPIPADARIFKVDSAGYHEFPGAVVSGNTVTLTLTDGGAGDADGRANGVIDDPVALAVPQAAVAPESSGGCSIAGTGGGPADFAGSYGVLALVAFALLARKAVTGKR